MRRATPPQGRSAPRGDRPRLSGASAAHHARGQRLLEQRQAGRPYDLREVVLRISNTLDGGLHVRVSEPPTPETSLHKSDRNDGSLK